MIRSPLSRVLLLIAFCAHVFAGLGNAQGLAWCFSAVGDARLEKNIQGECDTADPCVDHSRNETHADHGNVDPEHCVDCLDLPTFAQDVHHASRFSPDVELVGCATAALPSSNFSLPHPLIEKVPGFRPQPPPPQQLTLAFLRTVILII